jgi:hypothetical protein
MLINQEWLQTALLLLVPQQHQKPPRSRSLQKHENVLLLLQHHPKEKRLSWHYFSFHMRGRLCGLVIPSMSHSQLLLISLTYLAHARVTMYLASGVCIIRLVVACSTLACYIIWQLKGEERNIGSVQDILLKLRHNFMAFFFPPINLSLSLSQQIP